MPNLPQPLCSEEAGGSSKQRAAARLEEKIHFPSTPPQPPSWDKAGFHQERILEKKPREIGSFCFAEIAFPSNICSHSCTSLALGCAEGLQVFLPFALGGCSGTKGQEGPCTLCLLTHRIYRVSNRDLHTTAAGVYPAECTETPRAKWGMHPKHLLCPLLQILKLTQSPLNSHSLGPKPLFFPPKSPWHCPHLPHTPSLLVAVSVEPLCASPALRV